jgi:hypothetical protein
VVLSEQEAEDAWKVSFGGVDHLLISGQDFFADQDSTPGRVWLRSRGTREFAFVITPPLAAPLQASLPLTRTAGSSQADRFAAEAAARKPELQFDQIQPPGDAPKVRLGPAASWRPRGVAQAPSEAELASAANWSITLPAQATDGLSELYLQVDYQGDVAQLYSAHHLLTDDFYNGQPWLIGLDRFLDRRGSNTFELSILPLRQDAPVYFELPNPMRFAPNGQIDKLDGLSLIPEYQLMICTGAESSAQNSCRP